MIFFIPIILLVQFFLSAIYGWRFGVRKGIAASAITVLVFSIIAIFFSGLWVIPIAVSLPYLLIASVLGATSGTKLREGKKLIALALFIPLLVYWAGLITIEIKKEHELQLVVEFIKSNKEINLITGEGMAVQTPGGWTKSKNPFPFRYEAFFGSTKTPKGFYAFVDVTRTWWGGSPTFSLACVSSLSQGERDPRIDVCKQ